MLSCARCKEIRRPCPSKIPQDAVFFISSPVESLGLQASSPEDAGRICRISQRVRSPSSPSTTTNRAKSNPDGEPNFYSMVPLPPSPFSTAVDDDGCDLELLFLEGAAGAGPEGLLNTIGNAGHSFSDTIMSATVVPSPGVSYPVVSSSNECAFVPATRRMYQI